jgi:hypothetical protein
MKELLSLTLAIAVSLVTFAQCDPATIKDMPSVYTKYQGSRLAPEQEKSITTIFTSVVEHALKSTKGLRGDWKPMGGFPVTPEGLTKSVLVSYMFTMGCKDNKLYNKDEQGLVLNFNLNAFGAIYKSEIAKECSHEETKWKKIDDSRTVYIDDLLDGKQIYYLQPGTTSREYPDVAFYRKTDDGECFVIAKPGVPLFIPLTRRQALEINKKNYTNMLDEQKRVAAMPGLQPETRADYEKRMAKDFADYRKSIPDPEKFITDLIKQLEDMKPGILKQQQFWIDTYTKQISLVADYLKTTPAKELDKPCITGNTAILAASFGDNSDNVSNIKSNFDDAESGKHGMLVTLNPAYFSKTISKVAPQFISIELRVQGNSAIALKAYNDFNANLDLEKLKSILAK